MFHYVSDVLMENQQTPTQQAIELFILSFTCIRLDSFLQDEILWEYAKAVSRMPAEQILLLSR